MMTPERSAKVEALVKRLRERLTSEELWQFARDYDDFMRKNEHKGGEIFIDLDNKRWRFTAQGNN